jgi:hypothetical protein
MEDQEKPTKTHRFSGISVAQDLRAHVFGFTPERIIYEIQAMVTHQVTYPISLCICVPPAYPD